MKTFRITVNIACIVLSTILAIMCFTLVNDNTFGYLFSLTSVYLLAHLIIFER